MVYFAYTRESTMPESPDIKVSTIAQRSYSPSSSAMTSVPPTTSTIPRPLSSSSNISGMNGSHSPQSMSAANGGRTPSPPTLGSLMGAGTGQQLPPACGARQLSKLKRFLTTLQQFGSDISPEIGERVRTLVLGLVNSHLSIEEFHAKLQEATNFPLRPFVIPFLKANLPLLQRELHHCARIAKQSPQQFLAHNEQILFDPTHSPLDSRDNALSELNENGKRRSPDSKPQENGLDLHIDASPQPSKRHHGHHPVSPGSMSRISPGSAFNFASGPIRLEDISKSREMREREAARERMEREQVDRERDRERERERDRHFSGYNYRSTTDSFDHLDRFDDDWRHVETMLNCIIGMVDKTKRAMTVLQERSMRDKEETIWARRQADAVGMDATDVKKRSGDMMAYTIQQRAEEAVNDVKRQAMVELQKALSAADQKAAELVSAERAKMERAVSETRKQTQSELLRTLNHQEESIESCWNCGRKASETCSGCNTARYCGSFCQHKDWENHHHVCGKAHIKSAAEARELRRAAAAAAAAAVASTTATSSLPSSSSTMTSASSSSPFSLPSSTAFTPPGTSVAGAVLCGRPTSPSQSLAGASSPLSPSSKTVSTSKKDGVKAVSCSTTAPPKTVPHLSTRDRNSPKKTADSPASSPARTLSPVGSEPDNHVTEESV